MSLSAVVATATQDGAWVNDPLEVIVRNAAPGGVGANNKKKPSKCVLVDPKDANSILHACWFSGNFAQYDDKLVRIDGKSNKVSIYNGKVEFSVGKEGVVTLIGPAPAQAGTPPAEAGGQHAPAAQQEQPAGDPAAAFHRGMQKVALLWAHSYQYARNVEELLFPAEKKVPMPPDLFQSLTSSMFITAKDNGGLLKPAPKLRLTDDKGLPFRFIPDQTDPAAAAKMAADAAAKAAEEARLKAEAEAKKRAELDEDVPF